MTALCMVKRRLAEPPIKGSPAIACAVAAVAAPTVIRLLVDGSVSGIIFSPYLPFVFLAAVLTGWRHATFVALASAAAADFLFIEPRYQLPAGATDAFGIAVFLVTAMLIILLCEAARGIVRRIAMPAASDAHRTGIIFSLESGQAWVSWSGSRSLLRLGPESEVAEMMEDFLAQLELGRRLQAATRGLAGSNRPVN